MDLNLNHLRPDTRLEELPSDDCRVSPETSGRIVFELFDSRHDLPGILVGEGERMEGVISRTRYMEQVSRPFGLDLYVHRPARLLVKSIGCEPMVLPGDLNVHEAAHAALNRPPHLVFEPIVVSSTVGRGGWRLLDIHTLLLAQSGLLQLANETVERQRRFAEAANEAKSTFLANMSHEIRTPLTAILGFTENLLDPEMTDAERRSAVRTIVRNGEHLLEIINDILDLSKIEAGRLDVEQIRFSPARLVADVVSVMRVRADARRLPLRLTWRTPVPASIASDPTRLRQILINLLGNAIKFTEQGSVELQVGLDQSRGDPPRLAFSVIDTGIGMTSAQLGRLFEPFSQADQSTTRRFGGTGLGLAISRRLAEMLGGEITVASRAGEGTTFRLHIAVGPLEGVRMLANPDEETPAEQEAAAQPVPERLTGRILLAEDSPDNQLLICTFLRKVGAEVMIAENGEKAFELAMHALGEGRPFDVVLMDMQMPVLDGYEATRRLRSAGYARPIIALTANAMCGDQQQCFDAGCNDYATKPINRRQLLGQIARQMPGEAGATANTPSIASSGPDRPAEYELAADSPPPSAPAFDREVALSRSDGDPELVAELALILLQSGPEWIAQLDTALQTDDWRTLRRAAHTLKSAAENLGGLPLSLAATRLEALAAEARSAGIAASFASVVAEWNRLRPVLEAMRLSGA